MTLLETSCPSNMADVTITSENVVLAINALYGGQTPQQNAASAWLNNVQTSPHAWQVALELLAKQAAVEIHFFAANMLLTKVRNDWTHLQLSKRASLLGIVR